MKRYAKYLLHAAVLGGLGVAALKFVDGEQFVKSLHRFQWAYLPVVLGLSIAYVFVKGERFVFMMRKVTDAPPSVIRKAYVAGQACSLIPAGATARAGILEQAGIPAAETAAPLTISSLTDHALFLSSAVVAALWVESIRLPVLYVLSALLLVSILLGVEAIRTWLLGLITRLMGRLKILDHWRDFLRSLRRVATLPTLIGGLWNAALSFALMLGALYLCVKGVGGSATFTTLLLAFTLPSVMGRISAMPGGVGVTEAGMMSILGHAPGMNLDQAAAAVAVFRLGTVLFAALIGAAVYVFVWRGEREKTAVQEERTESVEPARQVEPEAAA